MEITRWDSQLLNMIFVLFLWFVYLCLNFSPFVNMMINSDHVDVNLHAEFNAISEAKEQVLANLANFAYDPDNYTHFKELNIVDLLLDQLEEDNENLVEFAIGGICNLALDKNFKELIFKRGAISSVIKCLSSGREETVLSAITALMFLVYPESKSAIVNPSVIDCMLRFQGSTNRRLSNLASVFLQQYCSHQEIENAKQLAIQYQNVACN